MILQERRIQRVKAMEKIKNPDRFEFHNSNVKHHSVCSDRNDPVLLVRVQTKPATMSEQE